MLRKLEMFCMHVIHMNVEYDNENYSRGNTRDVFIITE